MKISTLLVMLFLIATVTGCKSVNEPSDGISQTLFEVSRSNLTNKEAADKLVVALEKEGTEAEVVSMTANRLEGVQHKTVIREVVRIKDTGFILDPVSGKIHRPLYGILEGKYVERDYQSKR